MEFYVDCENIIMYQAIKENRWNVIKFLLDDDTDVNAPLWTTGSFAGYTALHVACMENKDDLVELLITECKADVNAVAEDGTQPIHLVCFYEPYTDEVECFSNEYKLCSLLKANANVDAEFGYEIFEKHNNNKTWCSDFDDKMTPIIYAVINEKPDFVVELFKFKANGKIISNKNKTLLMYAFENNSYKSAEVITSYIADPAYMNHRDNDGIPASHYFFQAKPYEKFRYGSFHQFDAQSDLYSIIFRINHAGGDMYALLNNDPATFLPNLAAYRGCDILLHYLLPRYLFTPHSKVLYYATLPISDNLLDIIQLRPDANPDDYPRLMNELRESRQNTIKEAVRDVFNRSTFGLFVSKEEIKLMNSLIVTDSEIKKFVDDYKKNFIDGKLKRSFIKVNKKKLSHYNMYMQVFDDRKVKLLVKNKNFSPWIDYDYDWDDDTFEYYEYFGHLAGLRVANVRERRSLLRKLKKISILRKCIDLPYELVLDIIEYLSNDELKTFINAFVS